MKINALLLPILLTVVSHAQTPSIDVAQAQRAFDEAKARSDREDGKLWGIPLFGPMLFVDAGTRRVVAHQADSKGLLQREGTLFTGTLPKEF